MQTDLLEARMTTLFRILRLQNVHPDGSNNPLILSLVLVSVSGSGGEYDWAWFYVIQPCNTKNIEFEIGSDEFSWQGALEPGYTHAVIHIRCV